MGTLLTSESTLTLSEVRGKGAHVNASTPGLREPPPPAAASRQGLLAGQSEEELERRLGVEDLRRELPLEWAEPLLAASAADWRSSGSQVTT